jgi:hypothetical protein
VLEEQPENLDVIMSLATVYEEQGKEEQALELVDFGNKDCLKSIYLFTSFYSHEKESRNT